MVMASLWERMGSCIFRRREDGGHSSSAASLRLKYINLPPVLIAPSPLAGGHYILSLASLVVLVSIGLAVALGGLFDNEPLQ